jgi:hypothetical protein
MTTMNVEEEEEEEMLSKKHNIYKIREDIK